MHFDVELMKMCNLSKLYKLLKKVLDFPPKI